MRVRCESHGSIRYERYGGRGIRVCEEWHDFEAFLRDMGECQEGMSLDRIDCDRHYEPGNCRWATREQQANNKSNNRVIEHDGQRLTLAQWSRKTGMHCMSIKKRLDSGWPVELALDPSAGRPEIKAWRDARKMEMGLMDLSKLVAEPREDDKKVLDAIRAGHVTCAAICKAIGVEKYDRAIDHSLQRLRQGGFVEYRDKQWAVKWMPPAPTPVPIIKTPSAKPEDPTRVRPFSNGTEFQMWLDRCCQNHCAKAAPPDTWPTCEVEAALTEAYVGDGTISKEIATRIGGEDERGFLRQCAEYAKVGVHVPGSRRLVFGVDRLPPVQGSVCMSFGPGSGPEAP